MATRVVLVCVALFVGFIAFRVVEGVNYIRKHPFAGVPGERAFQAANRQIISDQESAAFGNTAEARALAAEYSRTLKVLRTSFFSKEDTNGISLTDGNFVTYCHLDPDNCVFLVHVPQLRNFESDAKKSLEDLAWMNAESILQTKLAHPPQNLVVGVRGVIFYDAIMIGGYVSDPTNTPGGDGIKTRAGLDGEKLLYPFFAAEDSTNVSPNNP